MKGAPIAKRPPLICRTCSEPQRPNADGSCALHWRKGRICSGSGKPPALHCTKCKQMAAGELAAGARVGGIHYARVGSGFKTCGLWEAAP